MILVGFVDREHHGWPPPGPLAGIRVEVEVSSDTLFEEAARDVIRAAGFKPREYFYWPYLLKEAGSEETVRFPWVVIANDGEFLWAQGARSRITMGDLVRTREAGLTDGDPLALYLERPSYGDGILPGWEDFISWTTEHAYIAAAGILLGVVKKACGRWRARGATGPLAYIDLIVERDRWDLRDVCAWFGLKDRDARDMLTALGFEPSSEKHVWVLSEDSQRAELRSLIRRDYLHRQDDE